MEPLIRDLTFDPNRETMNRLVESIGAEYDTTRNSYSATLQAALTLDEVNQRISQAGLRQWYINHPTAERAWEQES